MTEEEYRKQYPGTCVVAAACRYGDVIITGARHYDRVMISQLKAFPEDHEVRMMNRGEIIQGFIDNRGNFLDRGEAYDLALSANQINPENVYMKGCLYSEDLY